MMKNHTIQLVTILMLLTLPSLANARGGYSSSLSSVSIGISRGGSGSFHYSQQTFNHSSSVNYHQRTVIRLGNGGRYYRGGGQYSVYYGRYYGSGRANHIHRQEGRRYVNDFPCQPVVVVPATYNRHHRHYRGCGCRY